MRMRVAVRTKQVCMLLAVRSTAIVGRIARAHNPQARIDGADHAFFPLSFWQRGPDRRMLKSPLVLLRLHALRRLGHYGLAANVAPVCTQDCAAAFLVRLHHSTLLFRRGTAI